MKQTSLIVPPDFRKALNRDRKAKGNFETMPPSHKREYIEAIVEAKKTGNEAEKNFAGCCYD
ncbi:MAG: YdeI/OmpD-associated family protein [Ignavibacteriae bacterium]|nr:YdeI/OmpD-associated family protein [Ignavibacteriota bacterium]